MTVTCPNCTAHLQLEDAKIPQHPFTVRCPKCERSVRLRPPARPKDASAFPHAAATAAADALPASRQIKNASSGQPSLTGGEQPEVHCAPPMVESDVAELLAALWQRGAGPSIGGGGSIRKHDKSWRQRRVLVCVEPKYADEVAHTLMSHNYDVTVADTTTVAIERMRESRMEVVILGSDFDPVEQGAIYIKREISSFRSAERRRLFIIHLTPAARTADTHAAFLSNVNLILNPADVEMLPQLLERGIHDLNDLYRVFNKALNIADL